MTDNHKIVTMNLTRGQNLTLFFQLILWFLLLSNVIFIFNPGLSLYIDS
jgi:hypothetical protein